MKKILSIALVLAMVLTGILSIVPVTASAEEAATTITPDTTWYDSSKTSFDISTAAQWYGLAKLISEETEDGKVTKGKTFNLTADIDLNPGWDATVKVVDDKPTAPAAPANAALLARFNYFAGTLNGNGHTVSGYYFSEAGAGVGYYGGVFYKLNGATVKNIVFKNGLVLTTGVTDDAGAGVKTVGMAPYADNSTIDTVFFGVNVWQQGFKGGNTDDDTTWLIGLVGITDTSAITMKNVVYGGSMGKYVPGEKYTAYATGTKATQVMHNQDHRDGEKWDHVVAAGDVYLPVPTREFKSMAATLFKINNATNSQGEPDGKFRGFYSIYGKYASINAAEADGAVTNPPEGYTSWNMTYDKNLGYIIPTAVWNMLNLYADTSWYDSAKTSFDISTAAQWYGLAKLISKETTAGSVTKGKTFNLTANIDLNPGWDATATFYTKSWKNNAGTVFPEALHVKLPGAPASQTEGLYPRFDNFAGTLNGNGHTVSGYYYKHTNVASKYDGGVIGQLKGGTIKNIIFENGAVIGNGNGVASYTSGFVVDFFSGTIENVLVDFEVWTVTYTGSARVSGLLGTKSNGDAFSRLKNVVFTGNIGKVTGERITENAGSTVECNQIMYNHDHKMRMQMDHVVAAGAGYFGGADDEKKGPAGKNLKINATPAAGTTDREYDGMTTHLIYGSYESIADAKAGKMVTHPSGYAENWNMAYSKKVGAVLPASVVAMLDAQEVYVQKTEATDGKVSVRILDTVDQLDAWAAVGFKVSVTYNGETVDINNGLITTETVWTSIDAAGAVVSAEALGGSYIYGISVKNVPEKDVVFNISRYAKDAKGNVYDLGNTISVNVADIAE